MNKESLKNFIAKNKWWLLIIFLFVIVRLVVFSTFWQASIGRGGWENFWAQSDHYQTVMVENEFAPKCGGFPLYITFTSVMLFLWRHPASIFLGQIFFSFISLIYTFKIAILFFNKRISYIATGLLAVEPFLAWHNFLLNKHNFYTWLFLAGVYYSFLLIQKGKIKYLYWAGFFFALSTFTRDNSLLLIPLLAILLLILYFFRKKLPDNCEFCNIKLKKILFNLVAVNLLYIMLLAGWGMRNYYKYDDFRLSNGYSTNVLFYNVPVLLAHKNNISFGEAKNRVKAEAEKYMGRKIDNIGDCESFTNAEYKKFLDYSKIKGKEYLRRDLGVYLGLHIFKSIPFYLQSGYFSMYKAYTGDGKKPDISSAIMSGNFSEIKEFLGQNYFKTGVYLGGIIFWLVCSLAVLFGLFFSFFRDRDKFYFFLISFLLILYNSLLVSPFVLARYRAPLYALFFISLIYLVDKTYIKFKKISYD